jgi:hypothetical protein
LAQFHQFQNIVKKINENHLATETLISTPLNRSPEMEKEIYVGKVMLVDVPFHQCRQHHATIILSIKLLFHQTWQIAARLHLEPAYQLPW